MHKIDDLDSCVLLLIEIDGLDDPPPPHVHRVPPTSCSQASVCLSLLATHALLSYMPGAVINAPATYPGSHASVCASNLPGIKATRKGICVGLPLEERQERGIV